MSEFRIGPGGRWSPRLLLVLAALAVGLLALTAAGCGGDDDEGEAGGDTAAAEGEGEAAGEGSIWVLLPDSASSPRWEADDRRFFDQAFTEAGVDHTIVNAENDPAQQQSQAEQAIAEGASVILLVSLDPGSGGAIIDIAKDADVQVVEYDRFNTGSSGGTAYVSFDNVQVGATMAEILEPEIDKLGGKPRVVMLNGGEEDNNAFLFRDGYNATVKERVDAGDWELVADEFVPGWGVNGEGQTIMEQILSRANNKVDAVFAANDNLAQQAINALEAAGVEGALVSGQDATEAGIQNVLLGKQTMTVYKPIEGEADVAAKVALALRAGEDLSTVQSDFDFELTGIKSEDGKPADAPEGEGIVPYLALTPIGVTADNIQETVIADGFRTVEEVCVGDVQQTDFCKEQG